MPGQVKLPTGYRLQAACVNCRHVFIVREFDCGPRCYCTFGAPPVPPCGSVLMGEMGPFEETEKQYAIWDEWSLGRSVDENGICQEYDEAKEADHDRT